MATQQIKEILDTEIPKPSFVLSPSVAAPLPSEMPFGGDGIEPGRSGENDVARTLDPISGKFKHVEEDTPRVYGSDQSLLVEGEGRTNYTRYSSDPAQWNKLGGTSGSISLTGVTSALDAETAQKIASGGSLNDRLGQNVGTFSSSAETFLVIIGEGSSGEARLNIVDTTTGTFNRIIYDFLNYSLTTDSNGFGSIDRKNSRVLSSNGPNGNRLVEIRISYSGQTSGNNRRVGVGPNSSVAGEDVILHHAQIEEAPNASSPIVTQGSSKRRAREKYKITGLENIFENEFTIIAEVVPRAYKIEGPSAWLSQSGYGRIIYKAGVSPSTPPYEISSRYAPSSNRFTPSINRLPAFEPSKIAFSLRDNDKRTLAVNGEAESQKIFGPQSENTPLNLYEPGDIMTPLLWRRISILPKKLSESELETITS